MDEAAIREIQEVQAALTRQIAAAEKAEAEKEEHRKIAENLKIENNDLKYKFEKEREAVIAHQENITNLHAEIERLNALRQTNRELTDRVRQLEAEKGD